MGFLNDRTDDVKAAFAAGDPERAAEIYHHALSEGPGTPEENAAAMTQLAKDANQ